MRNKSVEFRKTLKNKGFSERNLKNRCFENKVSQQVKVIVKNAQKKNEMAYEVYKVTDEWY